MKQREDAVRFFKLFVCCACFLFVTRLNAQEQPQYIQQAKQIRSFMDTLRSKMPLEKLYLHLDKFNYLEGDTIWFKAYLLEGAYLTPSTQSGIFYVELVSAENQVIKRMKFPVRYGLSWGSIGLDERDLPAGTYSLRAYTNWMLNFGQDAVFTTSIFIGDPNSKANVSSGVDKPGSTSNKPIVRKAGEAIGLRVSDMADTPQLEITVSPAADVLPATDYYLVGLSRDVVCYAVPINPQDGKIVKRIEKQLFPTGITRFVVLDRNLQAINEQMVYIDQQDQFRFSFNTERISYQTMDSIALHVRVTDKNNMPVQGSFSLAVTDDSQTSTGKRYGLGTYMLRVSDSLLYSRNPVHDWKGMFNKKTRYKAEPEFVISGRANSTFKGLSEARIGLFIQKPLMFMDTIAGPDGRFVFRNIPIADTAVYKIQARNKKGKNFFVTLEIDEWKPPVFEPDPDLQQTNSLLKDTGFVQKVQKALSLKQKFHKPTGYILDEVNIEAKKVVRGSHNLNGSGEADQVLTEKDLLIEGKRPLYELLMARIPGLVVGSYVFPPSKIRKFGLKLKNQLVKVIMDGIDLDQSYEYWQLMAEADDSAEGLQERYTHLKTNLDNFTAEDVKGIEVMYNASYNTKYNSKFLSSAETSFVGRSGLTGVGGTSGIDYTYIEITTRNGRGPFMKQTPGTYLYKPLAFSLPRKFYSPKYVNKDAAGIDIRSTIYWEPNIITDEKGEATVTFYSADQPASYTIVMEGSDMNGRMGSVVKPAFLKVDP